MTIKINVYKRWANVVQTQMTKNNLASSHVDLTVLVTERDAPCKNRTGLLRIAPKISHYVPISINRTIRVPGHDTLNDCSPTV